MTQSLDSRSSSLWTCSYGCDSGCHRVWQGEMTQSVLDKQLRVAVQKRQKKNERDKENKIEEERDNRDIHVMS